MMFFSYEKRALKRPRLGPPDVYPQDPKQKEDELTTINVKHGFSIVPQLSDEFGTARYCNVSASKIMSYINAIQSKKEEINTLPDLRCKRQNITPKDNFWPATARTKNAVEAWFKDLAGSKSLLMLSKKAPNFNKKEEIFLLLCEYQVPLMRGSWFIKLSSAYTVAVSEAKIKKRSMPDPMTEWTGTMLKFMKEQLIKLQDYYTQKESCIMTEEQKIALKQWNYLTQLTKYMYQDGLIDRQELLQWILDLLERMKSSYSDDGLKLVMPISLQYLDEFTQSELMSRKLAYLCSKKLSLLLNKTSDTHPSSNLSPNSPAILSQNTSTQGASGTAAAASSSANNSSIVPTSSTSNGTNSNNCLVPGQNMFSEYLSCPQHRDVVLALSSIIQVITLECPTALVWNCIGEGKSPSFLNGSPLDHLPCSPAMLPVPQRASNQHLKQQLRLGEELIRQRSLASEGRWSCDKWHQTSAGQTINKILSVLDALDRHSFERVDANNSLDTLYSKVFLPPGTKESQHGEEVSHKHDYSTQQDEVVVHILCEWAVSGLRFGEHRAIAVAKLLEKRQNEVSAGNSNNESEPSDDKDSVNSLPAGLPVFQSLLMKFLDQDAPSDENKTTFTNLVHLFAELIRHEVFSHDAYMCTLISRGDLPSARGNSVSSHPASNKPADTPSHLDEFDLKPKLEPSEHSRGHMDDDSKIDDDLDKLLQHIKEEQQNSLDAPDSPKDVSGSLVGGILHGDSHSHEGEKSNKPSRHQLYTRHFPIPQDESYQHDCNQRLVLLYGVGRERDTARHQVKKMTKELCKLFTKKFSIDVADGGKVKKHARSDFTFDQHHMSVFDQHYMTWQGGLTVLEMVQTFAAGNSSHLPVAEHVAFLFDVMESCLNIYTLLDVCIQLLKEITEVENQLVYKASSLMRSYTGSVVLYIVGVLRRYHSCLLLSPEQTIAAFEGLCKVVKNVSNPGDCSSVERCVLSHLYDLYSSCSLLKSRPHCGEMFSNAYPKIKQALYSPLQPSSTHHSPYNNTFMTDIISTYKKGVKIESGWVRPLQESSSNRYSFVCNAIMAVCSENTDVDRLNDIAILCAELTACCNTLSSEWLSVLMALCGSSSHPSYFTDVLSRVDILDLSIHNSLAIFTCILVARHCISLEDFVKVALPSLLNVCNRAGRRSEADISAEAGARLTCHLLLKLFKTTEAPQTSAFSVGTSPHSVPSGNTSSIRLGCDRHLLTAAHNNIQVGPLLAVLKAIIVVGDATANNPPLTIKKSPSVHQSAPGSNSGVKLPGELSISHILGTTDMSASNDLMMMELANANQNVETTQGLSEFALLVLREICTQEWVLERCLETPEDLCLEDMLLDSLLSPKQAQRLLHMICYPERTTVAETNIEHKALISHVLENLDQWTLRMSWLDMQLMYQQYASIAQKGSSSELNQWLDTVARTVVDIFQTNSGSGSEKIKNKTDSMWLVAPLISKLPSAVQGRVLKVAGQVLENCNLVGCPPPTSSSSSGSSSGRSGSKGTPQHSSSNSTPKTPTSQLAHHQPFLSLVLTCLKGQDDQREGLLSSLHSQLSQFLTVNKDGNNQKEKQNVLETPKSRALIQDALLLRFSLVGGLFDSIQRSVNHTTDWAILLTELIVYGVIDLNNNSELFSTVVDMLATLIHSTLVTDSQSEKGEENKKTYGNLAKKLKKEIGEKNSPSISHIRQLLPLAKQQTEVITTEPIGCLTDTKGNKIQGFDSFDKKQGLQVAEKQKVSSWDLLEGQKNPTPLSWTWFGAVRIERKPLWYEENHRLLKYHTHCMVKPSSYYLDPLPLPPEDLEPPSEKPMMKGGGMGGNLMGPDTPNSQDSSPRGTKRGGVRQQGGPPNQRRKKQTPQAQPLQQQNKPLTPTHPGLTPPGMHPCSVPQNQPGGPGNMGGYPSNQNPMGGYGQCPPGQGAQWSNVYGQQMPQQTPQGPPGGYYQQPMPVNGGGPRFDPQHNQSKRALTKMLQMKAKPNPSAAGGMQPNFSPMQRQPFMRQQMRPSMGQQNPMFQNQQQQQVPPQQQQPQYSNMGQQQGMNPMFSGMNQNYPGGYPNQQMQSQQMMGQQPQQPQSQQQMFSQQNVQGGAGQGGPNQFAMRQQQEYQQAQQRGRPYLAPNVTMSGMSGPAPPYTRPSGPQQQNQMQMQQQMNQQQQQQRIRQQMMQQAMQQGQQGPPPTPALVAHLQRQIPPPQQNPQQQGHYGMQPPPY